MIFSRRLRARIAKLEERVEELIAVAEEALTEKRPIDVKELHQQVQRACDALRPSQLSLSETTKARSRPYDVHPHFTPATNRGVLPCHPESGAQGISFDLEDGTIIRLWLPWNSVGGMIQGLTYHRDRFVRTDQSDMSSGKPARDGSSPDGQSVCPDTSSSNAEVGDE
jgi:hypothetical protein